MLIVEGYEIHINKNPEEFTDGELYDFCVINKGLRIERDKDQNIIIMAPGLAFLIIVVFRSAEI